MQKFVIQTVVFLSVDCCIRHYNYTKMIISKSTIIKEILLIAYCSRLILAWPVMKSLLRPWDCLVLTGQGNECLSWPNQCWLFYYYHNLLDLCKSSGEVIDYGWNTSHTFCIMCATPVVLGVLLTLWVAMESF